MLYSHKNNKEDYMTTWKMPTIIVPGWKTCYKVVDICWSRVCSIRAIEKPLEIKTPKNGRCVRVVEWRMFFTVTQIVLKTVILQSRKLQKNNLKAIIYLGMKNYQEILKLDTWIPWLTWVKMLQDHVWFLSPVEEIGSERKWNVFKKQK